MPRRLGVLDGGRSAAFCLATEKLLGIAVPTLLRDRAHPANRADRNGPGSVAAVPGNRRGNVLISRREHSQKEPRWAAGLREHSQKEPRWAAGLKGVEMWGPLGHSHHIVVLGEMPCAES
jgi:hypothetical protein